MMLEITKEKRVEGLGKLVKLMQTEMVRGESPTFLCHGTWTTDYSNDECWKALAKKCGQHEANCIIAHAMKDVEGWDADGNQQEAGEKAAEVLGMSCGDINQLINDYDMRFKNDGIEFKINGVNYEAPFTPYPEVVEWIEKWAGIRSDFLMSGRGTHISAWLDFCNDFASDILKC